jgi:hypothetical protein
MCYPNANLDDDPFFLSIFTRRASRKLPSAALLRARNSFYYGFALKCLTNESLRLGQDNPSRLKVSDWCKIKVPKWAVGEFM